MTNTFDERVLLPAVVADSNFHLFFFCFYLASEFFPPLKDVHSGINNDRA